MERGHGAPSWAGTSEPGPGAGVGLRGIAGVEAGGWSGAREQKALCLSSGRLGQGRAGLCRLWEPWRVHSQEWQHLSGALGGL